MRFGTIDKLDVKFNTLENLLLVESQPLVVEQRKRVMQFDDDGNLVSTLVVKFTHHHDGVVVIHGQEYDDWDAY